MFKITVDELEEFIIRPLKCKKNEYEMDDTISIVMTTQGKNINKGININIHVSDFLDYNYVGLYALGNRLYFVPSNDNLENKCFRLSQNPTSKCLNTKIGNEFGVKKLVQFIGNHKIYRATDNKKQKQLFYIEIET